MPKGTRTELRAVLFTDVVASSDAARQMGDERWSELLRRERRLLRQFLSRHGGREIDTAGDGLFAVFERPAEAVRCAFASVGAVQSLGVDIRAGVHFGEIETSGGGAHGIVVHTGARVMSIAGPAQVLVTATVKDLVAGGRITLEPRGTHELKGVPGEWVVYDVVRVGEERPPEPLSPATALERREDVTVASKRPLARSSIIAGAAVAIALAAFVIRSLWPQPSYVPGVDTVARIDPTSRTFGRPIEVGSFPIGLSFGLGRLWAIDQGDAKLVSIEPEMGVVVASRGTLGTPTGLAVGEDAVWITNAFGAGTGREPPVSKVDPTTLEITPFISVPPGSAAIAAGAGGVWVADREAGAILRLDPLRVTTDRIELRGGSADVSDGDPTFIAVAPSPHEYVWVADALRDEVYRFSPSRATPEVETIQIGDPPTEIAVSDDAIWITSYGTDKVFELDPVSGSTVTTLELGERGCDGPTGIAPVSGGVWIACSLSHRVVMVDPASLRIVARLEVDGAPDAIVADRGGGVWVAIHVA